LDEPYLDGTLVSKESKNVANTEKAGVFVIMAEHVTKD